MTIASAGTVAAADRSLAMTPDGARVVYVGINNQLMVHALDRLDPIAIHTGAGPLNWVFVSPDGRWVGFADAQESGHHGWAGPDDRADQSEDRGDLGAG
jgi:hypothetical protein